MVSVTLGQHQWEQKLKDDLSIIHRVSGDVGNKPVPELRQGPANKVYSSFRYIKVPIKVMRPITGLGRQMSG